MTRLHRAGVLAVFGAATCAALAMPVAGAEPEPTPKPAPATPTAAPSGDCSAAGLSATISSVMKATSDYLGKHPDVNQALLDATRQPAFIAVGQMDDFFSSHPQEADEVRAIQQPARDYQNRCGLVVEPAEAFMALQNL
ncbi:MAG TPA: heme-binding protein [Mycobacterium sp.]